MFLTKVKIHSSKFYNYKTTQFITSSPDMRSLPIDNGAEIAFTGYSNSGKSSALNTLSNQKNLAKTSKIPGSTQLINLFEVKPGIRLVDFPGYGYAKIPNKLKYKWRYTLIKYLQKRKSLKGMVVVMDIRHPMKYLDQKILEWAVNFNIPVLVLLTKSDKVTSSICKIQLNQVSKSVQKFIGDVEVEIFSSLKKQGVNKLQQKLDTWFTNVLPKSHR